MKILFAGTPDFSVPALKAIATDHEIVGVLTQPDRRSGRGKKITEPPVKITAKSLSLKVYQPNTLVDHVDLIKQLAPEIMVVVAYGVILPQAILDIPKHGCLNIHASLLPRWRGAAPIQRAIEAGDTNTGVCIMRMEAGLDTGPVLETQRIAIDDDDTSSSLHDKLSQLGAETIVSVLHKLAKSQALLAEPQNHDIATYAHKINKAEADIDWTLSAVDIERRTRAFNPWPIVQTTHKGTRLRIWHVAVITDSAKKSCVAGEVLEVDNKGASIACGEGVLRIQTLQRDGSKPMSYDAFRNGYTICKKDILG